MDMNVMTQTIPKFNEKGDLSGHALFNEWLEWKVSFEIWAEAMNIHSQAQKFSWLLVAGGREIQRIYSSTPKSKDEVLEIKFPWIEIPQYENAISRLDSYFEAKSNPILERQLLNELKQQVKEPFNAFLVRLRTQAMRCGFDEKRVDEEVYFQIMRGVRSEKVKQYAATETGKSVDQLISYAINEEIKQQQRQESNEVHENIQDASIAAIKKYQKPPYKNNNYQQQQGNHKCNRCGSGKHIGGLRCPAIGMTCHFCKGIGHFGRVCMKKRREGKSSWSNSRERFPKKEVIQAIGDEEENWDAENSQQVNNAIINANIGGVDLKILIDSGSPINTLTEDD